MDNQRLESGLRVLVFEQAATNVLGLTLAVNAPRRTFIASPGHPALAGVQAADLWHWRGEADLDQAYPPVRTIPEAAGGWFPERFWKWGNGNNVATYVIQKPMRGAFRALIESGFDLMDTPLLESCKGRGRIVFCQLDVTNRYGSDPTATHIVDNLLAYLGSVPEPDPRRSEVLVAAGEATFEGWRLRKPDGDLGWGMNDGDFYFRQKVRLPAFAGAAGPITVRRGAAGVAVSYGADALQNTWQQYKLARILAALRMNQGGSSADGVSTALQGDDRQLYPLNWHRGFVHPYTGWCW